MNRNLGIIVVLSIFLLFSQTGSAQITVKDLDLTGGVSSARAINNMGQVVGHINNETIATYWNLSNDSFTLLETPGRTIQFITSSANAINDLGQTVGEYDNSKPWAAEWNLSTGALMSPNVTIIGSVIDTSGVPGGAFGINSLGQAVGEKFLLNPGVQYHALFWNISTGTITDLGKLGGTNSHARGVNEIGQAVGYSDFATDAIHATLWYLSNGTIIDLGTLQGGTNSFAYSINNLGQVVGEGDNESGVTHAILWDLNTGNITDLGLLDGGTGSVAFSINDMEQAVGSSTISGLEHATFWNLSDGSITDMGTIAGGTFGTAFGINNLGQAVGESGNSTTLHATLWNIGTVQPTPKQIILKLVESAQNLVSSGILNKGQGNSLIVKFYAATNSLDKGNNNAAINQLHAVNNQVMAFNNAGILSTADAQSLTNAVNNVIGAI